MRSSRQANSDPRPKHRRPKILVPTSASDPGRIDSFGTSIGWAKAMALCQRTAIMEITIFGAISGCPCTISHRTVAFSVLHFVFCHKRVTLSNTYACSKSNSTFVCHIVGQTAVWWYFSFESRATIVQSEMSLLQIESRDNNCYV